MIVSVMAVTPASADPAPTAGPAPMDDPVAEANFTWLVADGVGTIGSTAMYIQDGDLDIFIQAFPGSGTSWDPSTVTEADIIIQENHGHFTHYDADTVAMVQRNTGAIVVGNAAMKADMLARSVPASKIVELTPTLGGTDKATNVAGCNITAIGMYHTMATSTQVDTYLVEMPSGISWFHGTCAAGACYNSYIKNRDILDDLDMMALDFEHNFNTVWDEKEPKVLIKTHTFSVGGVGYLWDDDPSSSSSTTLYHNDTYNYQKIIEINLPPVLSLGSATPLSGTEDDPVTFDVFYVDANDDAPVIQKVFIRDDQGITVSHDLIPVPSGSSWINGRTLRYTSKLAPGTYTFRFNATDGGLSSIGDIDWNPSTVTITPRNTLPELQSPDQSPREGDTTTEFRFDVMYRDMDNEEPASARLFLDGEAYDMVSDTVSGPWNDWVTFYCETTLGVGATHRYYFLFTDGQDQIRYPVSTASPNWLPGPTVELPNFPPSLTTNLYSPQTGTRDTQFTFTVIYSDSENDHPLTSWLYIDDVPNIMTGDGSSDFIAGVQYRYTTKLDIGPQPYYLVFSDGEHLVRLPQTGTFDGPEVLNQVPTGVISSPGNGARFTPDDYVAFRSVGSEDPDGDGLTFIWSSDLDGELGEGETLDVILSEGEHVITLTVADDFGGSNFASISIVVRPYLPEPVVRDVEVNNDRPIEGDIVRLTAQVGNDGEIKATGLIVRFLVDGTETGTETVSIDKDATKTVTFTWTAVPGSHILSVEAGGSSDQIDLEVEANTVPTSDPFILNEGTSWKPGVELFFKPAANDANNDPLAYHWDFDDGINSTKDAPNHIYADPGTYTITLTVTDTRGGETVETLTVEIIKPKQEEESPGPGAVLALVSIGLVFALVATRRRRT